MRKRLQDNAEKRPPLPRADAEPGGGAFPPPADSTGAAEAGRNGPSSRQGHTAAPATFREETRCWACGMPADAREQHGDKDWCARCLAELHAEQAEFTGERER